MCWDMFSFDVRPLVLQSINHEWTNETNEITKKADP